MVGTWHPPLQVCRTRPSWLEMQTGPQAGHSAEQTAWTLKSMSRKADRHAGMGVLRQRPGGERQRALRAARGRSSRHPAGTAWGSARSLQVPSLHCVGLPRRASPSAKQGLRESHHCLGVSPWGCQRHACVSTRVVVTSVWGLRDGPEPSVPHVTDALRQPPDAFAALHTFLSLSPRGSSAVLEVGAAAAA